MPHGRKVPDMIADALQKMGSLKDLADDVGVSYPTLWLWSQGKRNPTPANLRKLAEALRNRGVDLLLIADDMDRHAGGDDGQA